MRISDWSSDVCSSDLTLGPLGAAAEDLRDVGPEADGPVPAVVEEKALGVLLESSGIHARLDNNVPVPVNRLRRHDEPGAAGVLVPGWRGLDTLHHRGAAGHVLCLRLDRKSKRLNSST